MRHLYMLLPVLFPLCAFSQSRLDTDTTFFTESPVSNNTVVTTYSNEADPLNQTRSFERTTEYPTQIVRMSGSLSQQQLSCEQANEIIDKSFVKFITSDKFIYNIYISCVYDPETKLATQFSIHSYFDPLNDKAIDYLKSYLAEYNGSALLGTQLKIESAKALIISLNIIAGVKKNPHSPLFIEHRKDRNNYYFNSNYEMRNTLLADVYEKFFSNEPDKVLPFFNKWLSSYADKIYNVILRDANYVELQPERIFIMNNGDEIFVSNLKYYFAHNCTRYENRHCLKQDVLTE